MNDSDHVVAMETVSDERLAEILAGLEGVTPGEWRAWIAPSGQQFVRAVYLDDQGRRCTAWPAECSAGGQDNERNAAHIARLDPEIVRSIISELIASRLAKQAPDVIEDDYVIWSNEHKLWWGPNSAGYRSNLALAGRYSRAEALEIAKGARDGWTADGNPDEIAVPLRDAEFCLPSPVLGEAK